MKKPSVSGLRDDYGHEPLLDEELKQGLSEFSGISDGGYGVSRAQADLQDSGDYDGEDKFRLKVRREQPSVTEVFPFRGE